MLSNKTAIITGANKGIGKATVELFLNQHATVWACSGKKNNNKLDYLIKNFKNKLNIINFDFANLDEVKVAANTIINESDSIDILVNNAGVIHSSLFEMTKIQDMKNLFDINFFSQLYFIQILIKKLKKSNNASIINISSTAALDPFEGRISYSASKSAFLTFSKILSKELGRYKIRVNSIAPGLTNTELMKNSHSETIIEQTIDKTTLKKIAQPLDIANAILFFASEMSSHITGQNLRIDGGL